MIRKYQIYGLNNTSLKENVSFVSNKIKKTIFEDNELVVEIYDTTKEEAYEIVVNYFSKVCENIKVIEVDDFLKRKFTLSGKTGDIEESLSLLNINDEIDFVKYDKTKKVLEVSFVAQCDIINILHSLLPKNIHIKDDTYIKKSIFFISKWNKEIKEFLEQDVNIIETKYEQYHLEVTYKELADVKEYLTLKLNEYDPKIHFHAYLEDLDTEESLGIPRIILGSILIVIGNNNQDSMIGFIFILAAFILLGYDILYRTISNLSKGKIFDGDFTISLASVLALVLNYQLEAAIVMLVYQVSVIITTLIKKYCFNSSEKIISKVPVTATNEFNDIVYVEQVSCGDTIIVKHGDIIPLDGIINFGGAKIVNLLNNDETRHVNVNDYVEAGWKNLGGMIKIEVTSLFNETKIYKFRENIQKFSDVETKFECFMDKFNSFYSPVVMIMAMCFFILPFVFGLDNYRYFIDLGIVFLIVSCPVAISISTPLSYFAGLIISSRNKITINSTQILEKLGEVKCLIIEDEFLFENYEFKTHAFSDENVYKQALSLASYCNLMQAVTWVKDNQEFEQLISFAKINEFQQGVMATYKGSTHILCNCLYVDKDDNNLYYLIDDVIQGVIYFDKKIVNQFSEFINDLHEIDIKKIIVFSNQNNDYYGVDEVHNNLSIKEKQLIIDENKINNPLLVATDLALNNDHLVLSMNGRINNCYDCLINEPDIMIIKDMLRIGHKIKMVNYVNIFIQVFIKILMLVATLIGVISIVSAILIDVCVSAFCCGYSVFAVNRYKRNYR